MQVTKQRNIQTKRDTKRDTNRKWTKKQTAKMGPEGFEPTTDRLWAGRSTTKLQALMLKQARNGAAFIRNPSLTGWWIIFVINRDKYAVLIQREKQAGNRQRSGKQGYTKTEDIERDNLHYFRSRNRHPTGKARKFIWALLPRNEYDDKHRRNRIRPSNY